MSRYAFGACSSGNTRKINQFPIIVFDRAYHKELLEHIEQMKNKKTISKRDLDLILVTDSIDEALTFIKDQSIKRYGLVTGRKPAPIKWLFEHA